jgi:hypothetical protein
VAGNLRSLQRLYDNVERYWRTMLSRRNRKGMIGWDVFQQMKRVYPLQRPKLFLPYTRIKSDAVLSSRVCRAWCGKSARHVLWEPVAGDCHRRPGEWGNLTGDHRGR